MTHGGDEMTRAVDVTMSLLKQVDLELQWNSKDKVRAIRWSNNERRVQVEKLDLGLVGLNLSVICLNGKSNKIVFGTIASYRKKE